MLKKTLVIASSILVLGLSGMAMGQLPYGAQKAQTVAAPMWYTGGIWETTGLEVGASKPSTANTITIYASKDKKGNNAYAVGTDINDLYEVDIIGSGKSRQVKFLDQPKRLDMSKYQEFDEVGYCSTAKSNKSCFIDKDK